MAAVSPMTRGSQERLPSGTLATYALPAAAVGFAFFLVNIFFMKFATDVLGIAAATMGWIYLVSRVWDAVSDPIVGFLSDRTRTRLGRRRPWMLAAALPVGVSFVMLWSPPSGLSGGALTTWVAVSFILVYTALTAFLIPHDALGAELTSSYLDRTRVFGWRRIFFGVGAIGAMIGVGLLTRSEDIAVIRATGTRIAVTAAVLVALLFAFAGARLRERPEHWGRGGRRPFRAVADVWRNPHARLLVSVFFIQQVAVVSLTLMTPYYTDYILRDAQSTAPLLLAFMVSGTVSIPLWVRISSHFEKKSLLLAGMTVIGVAIGAMFFLGEGDVPLILVLAVIAGIAAGGTDTIFPSIQADVIDYDEYQTHERKEGTYFAVWAFAAKTAAGVVGILAGFLLQGVGYEPNAEQTPEAALAIRGLFAGFPFLCYTIGILLFLRFRLGAREHAEIRQALDARTPPLTSPGH